MTMVLEEDSNIDASSIMMSQSRIASSSVHKSVHKKKFVYPEEDPETGLQLELDGEDDSSESDDNNS